MGVFSEQTPLTDQFGDVSQRSIGDMIGEVTQDLSTLMRQELALARAELKQEAAKAGKASGMFAGAAVAAHMVVLFLSLAAWAGLSNVMDAGWAGLLVAVVWAAAAGGLYVTARDQMRKVRGLPRTAETVQQIPHALTPNRGVQ
ncbi:MAG TPA: phage holin family protein [Pilimelia sp.]|nr:phage holin family protein [Pilimelia sp.]